MTVALVLASACASLGSWQAARAGSPECRDDLRLAIIESPIGSIKVCANADQWSAITEAAGKVATGWVDNGILTGSIILLRENGTPSRLLASTAAGAADVDVDIIWDGGKPTLHLERTARSRLMIGHYEEGSLRDVASPPGAGREIFLCFYPMGGLKCAGANLDGVANGRWTTWSESGPIHVACDYRAGQIDGLVEAWHPNGRLESTGNFKADRRVGTWSFWNETGTLTKTTDYGLDASPPARPQ